jgi:hypothetical protein
MSERQKKYPCPDCHYCQWCSDDRCRLCLRSDCCKKLSIAEQIQQYEKLNRDAQRPSDKAEASTKSRS